MISDEEARELVRAFGRAANQAVEESPEAQRALEALRAAGVDTVLRVRIARTNDSPSSDEADGEIAGFTDADLKELGRMSIRVK